MEREEAVGMNVKKNDQDIAASQYAMRVAEERFGSSPDMVKRSIAVFCLASFPGYFMLLLFGFRQESVEIPMLLAGCIGVGIAHFLEWERQRNWLKTYEAAYQAAKQDHSTGARF